MSTYRTFLETTWDHTAYEVGFNESWDRVRLVLMDNFPWDEQDINEVFLTPEQAFSLAHALICAAVEKQAA